MTDEAAFLRAFQENPKNDALRLIYADWLEERGDVRGEFLRLQLALRSLSPDHVHRDRGEQELSRLRKGIDLSWLEILEPECAHLYQNPPRAPQCTCFDAGYKNRKWSNVEFHVEPQNTECRAWKHLLDLIEEAAADEREEFAPRNEMRSEDWVRIVTLPPTIAKLKKVRRLLLYGSHLIRIPP